MAHLTDTYGTGVLASREIVATRKYGDDKCELSVPLIYKAFIEPFTGGLSERLKKAIGQPTTSTELIETAFLDDPHDESLSALLLRRLAGEFEARGHDVEAVPADTTPGTSFAATIQYTVTG